jgi:hypothetical protein
VRRAARRDGKLIAEDGVTVEIVHGPVGELHDCAAPWWGDCLSYEREVTGLIEPKEE